MADTGQVRYGFPAYRVFIYGVEVTDDVVSVNSSMHDGGAPNQCQITLLNKDDRYIITTQDILAIKNIDAKTFKIPWMPQSTSDKDLKSSTVIANDLSQSEFSTIVQGTQSNSRKRLILDRKKKVEQEVSVDLRQDIYGNPISSHYTDYFGTKIKRYPLIDGWPVFHAMDPVRVVYRDPFNPSRWYWGFSGFLSDLVDTSNENNVKTLALVAEDPTKLFRYTRTFINPGILDAARVITDNDLKIQSFNTHAMTGMNLPEVFYTMMFGPDKIGAEDFIEKRDGPDGESNIRTRMRGIGHFSFDTSVICTFGPKPDEASTKGSKTHLLETKEPIELGGNLQMWQLMLDHEVQPSDMWMMATDYDRDNNAANIRARCDGLNKRDGKLLIEDVITYICTHPDQYLIDGGRLMMLIPNSLGAYNSDVLTKDIIQSYALQSEWQSAGQMLMDVIGRIEFSMYCTPKGDIVIEPPLYDFSPDDFGLMPISQHVVADLGTGQYDELGFAESTWPGGDRGPFGNKYIILKSDTYNWENAIVDEKVYTMAVSKNSIFQNWDALPYSDITGDVQAVRLPDLIPLYGVRDAPVTPRGYINTREGAHLYANIVLNRLNADAHTMHIVHTPNIQMWVNRPIYIQGRNCIGTTKNVTHSIVWGQQGTVDTTSDLYAIRSWSGEMDKNDPTKPIYTSIGGSGSRPLDYAMLFKRRAAPRTDEDNRAARVATDIDRALKGGI